jgi:hypothetical protein
MTKRPIGRPRTTLKDLPDDWKNILFRLAEKGYGPTTWCIKLGLTQQSYSTLKKHDPEFHLAIEWANCLHLCYYEDEGRRLVEGGKGNGRVYCWLMFVKFGWRTYQNKNKVVGEVTSKRELTDEELTKELKARGLPTRILIGDGDC